MLVTPTIGVGRGRGTKVPSPCWPKLFIPHVQTCHPTSTPPYALFHCHLHHITQAHRLHGVTGLCGSRRPTDAVIVSPCPDRAIRLQRHRVSTTMGRNLGHIAQANRLHRRQHGFGMINAQLARNRFFPTSRLFHPHHTTVWYPADTSIAGLGKPITCDGRFLSVWVPSPNCQICFVPTSRPCHPP